MSRFIKAPIFWFILLGGTLFVLDQYINPNNDQIITITQGDVDKIRSQWKAQSDKELTPTILKSLLQEEINQQRLYKEALSLNLDQDDVIIKRRLIQKLRFVMTELSNSTKPSTLELRKYYEKYKENYIRSSVISFRHIFMGSNKTNEDFSVQLSVLFKELNQNPNENKNWKFLGKPFMHGNYFSNQSIEQLSLQFSLKFVNDIMEMKTGQWRGPIDSLYGSHLVFVENIQPASEMKFDNSKELIEHDYHQSQQADNHQRYLDRLAEKYPVTLENFDADLNNIIFEKILPKK